VSNSEKEANRAAAQKRLAEESSRRAESEDGRRNAEEEARALIAEARTLIPAVLELRARNNFKGIAEIKRRRRKRFGGYKEELVGAYFVCKLTTPGKDDAGPRPLPVYLCSDGYLHPFGTLNHYAHLLDQRIDARFPPGTHYGGSGREPTKDTRAIVEALRRMAAP
jgi:hypothetical protein